MARSMGARGGSGALCLVSGSHATFFKFLIHEQRGPSFSFVLCPTSYTLGPGWGYAEE